VSNVLSQNPGLTSQELVPLVYTDVAQALHGWAERSLLAHLIKLEKDQLAFVEDSRWKAIEA
jgi:hypothetical protein